MDPKFFSPEERVEYDALMVEAVIDPHTGKPYKSGEYKIRVLRFLRDAEQAGRKWAEHVIEDATVVGCGVYGGKWVKERDKVKFKLGDVVMETSRFRANRMRNAKGKVEHQQLDMFDMDVAQLEEVRDDCMKRRDTEGNNAALVSKLIELVNSAPDCRTPREAAAALGTTVDAFLLEGAC